MSVHTKDILVEITSTNSLEFCKRVMEELIIEMFQAGLSSSSEDNKLKMVNESFKNLKLNSANDVNASINDEEKPNAIMWVQQVKILDSKGSLKCVYPSRVDLTFNNSNKFRVARLYDE